MKKTLIVIGALVVLVVVALFVAPAFIPVETYKTELLQQVEKATGRKAKIEGDFAISLLPRAEFTAGKFSLANAPGGKASTMVSLDRLDVRIGIMPLLSGTVVIDSFVLDKPVINLEIDSQGRANWAFAPAGATPSPAAGKADGGGGGMALGGLQLGDVRLVGGRVSYSDARTGAAYAVEDINMAVSLPSLASPMRADGSLVYNKEKIALKLGVEKPNALLAGEPTPLDAAVVSSPVKLKFKGRAQTGAAVKAGGALDLDVPSIRKLAAWAGAPLKAPGDGFGPLKIAGTVSVDGKKYGFTKARIELDKIKGTGDFRFDGGGRLPYVNARLDLGQLDLNPYLPPEQKTAATPAPGAAKSAGWSDDPIDLGGLRQANADAELNVEGLLVRKIKVGKSQIKVALKDGRLTTDLTRMALYDGNGTARLAVNASGAAPVVAARFDLSGLKANPALSDAIDLDRIEGTLASNFAVQTGGKSQRAMISALNGDGKVKFTNGAIRGINLGAMVRNVSSAFLDPKARETQKTDFAELSGTFTIRHGIVSNNDLALLSPLLRIGGKGTVDLPQQSLNYRIEPKLAATSKGQGGSADVAGIMVPVVASGPWSNISYRPDLSGMIGGIAKDPTKALEGVKKLIPGSTSTPGGTGGGSTLPKPADALKNLFGR